MSVNQRVVRDTKHRVQPMSEAAVRLTYERLDALTKLHHRGRHDTWTAARDRAAKTAGIEPSYAKRIWDRWQSMKDVSGGAFYAIEQAYQRLCERSEAAEAAQATQAERIALATAHEITLAAALERRQQRMAATRASKASKAPTATS